MKRFIVLAALLMAGCEDHHETKAQAGDWHRVCIEGVTYIGVNTYAGRLVLSPMLNRESKVIPCKSVQ